RSVMQLVRDGAYLHNAINGSRVTVPVADRIAHLENLIALLHAHDNYEIALVDEGQEGEIPIPQGRFWEVVGGMRVFTNIHVRDPQGCIAVTGIMIAEPSLVGAFEHYFEDLWARVAPRDKDKGFVTWWLGRQVGSLR